MDNSIEINREKGRQKLRELQITFTEFKRRVSAMMTYPNVFDEDDWVSYFNSYAEGVCNYFETIEEFAANHFLFFTEEEHGTQLKTP